MPELISSPFSPAFRSVVSAARGSLVLCSPYITAGPLEELVRVAQEREISTTLQVSVLTDLSAANLVQGATDAQALHDLTQRLPGATVRYLPRLHAKVFVADDALALVGSANFTDGGAFRNLEYGVCFDDAPTVRRVRADIEGYAALGSPVSPTRLRELAHRSRELRDAVSAEQRSLRAAMRQFTRELTEKTETDLFRIRVEGRSTNAIFSDTIVFLLSRGALATDELNAGVQQIHPDLCDDTADRVIDGKHYGKLWKHQVRGAQVSLRRQGRVQYDPAVRLWSVAAQEQGA